MSVGVLGKLLARAGDPIDEESSERRLLGFSWFEGASAGISPRSSFIGGELGKVDRGELVRGELGSRPLVVGRGIASRRGGGSASAAAARFWLE